MLGSKHGDLVPFMYQVFFCFFFSMDIEKISMAPRYFYVPTRTQVGMIFLKGFSVELQS